MEPSESQSSSNIGGDQAKDNKFKHRGQIVFRMPNFRAFSVGRGPNEVFSEPVVFINGLPWRIKIKRVIETYVGCFIECNGEKSVGLST
uniref:MATH domain-containing protein n=1 Tax=Globodera pallida TaxID=36090 RepID=A0A183CKG7_GLOPA